MSWIAFLVAASTLTVATNGQLPSCKTKCRDIDIPYPFGIGEGCYAKEYGDFSINCTADSRAFLGNSGEEIISISVGGELRIRSRIGYDCFDRTGGHDFYYPRVDLGDRPFTFSHRKNKFVVIGCDTDAYIWDQYGTRYSGGCMSYCESIDSFRDLENNSSCSGLGCCGVSIPRGIRTYTTRIKTYNNYSYSMDFNDCGFIFLIEQDQYNFSFLDLKTHRMKTEILPVVLDWSVGAQTCENAKKNRSLPYACRSENSECIAANNLAGYLCNCSTGYQGNPYITGGCRDVDECVQRPSVCPSEATCRNTVGNYSCNCPPGYRLNWNFPGGCEDIDECQLNPCKDNEYCGKIEGISRCISKDGVLSLSMKLGLGIGGGLLV